MNFSLNTVANMLEAFTLSADRRGFPLNEIRKMVRILRDDPTLVQLAAVAEIESRRLGIQVNTPGIAVEAFRKHEEEVSAMVLRSISPDSATVLRSISPDSARLDMLEALVTEGYVSACFETDGGVFLRVDRPGADNDEEYRERNTIRECLDAAMEKARG